ncbi:MAG: aldo/keto reductase [Acidobacteria bacterium]|nr:aldo/keto reductase [Acidobacteriota bacterium]
MLYPRPLGSTGLDVPILGLGAGRIGDPSLDDAVAGRILNEALDLGLTLIDAAPSYGVAEERIGRHLAHRRHEIVLSTKLGYGVEGVPDWTGEAIARGIDRALVLLRTDRIDVAFLQSCPVETLRRDDIAAALADAVASGKVGVAGYSGDNEPLDAALESNRFGALMVSVNIFDQAALEHVTPVAAERGVGIVAKRPVGNAPWRFAARPTGDYAEEYWLRMRAMGLELGDRWFEVALRFAAWAPGVACSVFGTAMSERLSDAVEAVSKGPLDDETVGAIRESYHAHGAAWRGEV